MIAGSAAFPLVVDAPRERDHCIRLRERRAELLAELRRHGAIRFSAAEVDSPERLAAFARALLGERGFGYAGGDSPRTRLSASVYTSTEFPPEFGISLHNELSYSARYPEFVIFCCAVPADDGGETPLADSRRLLAALDPALVARFERSGVTYVRNLHGGDGIGRSWQATFETSERGEVEALCARAGAEARWKPGGGLQVRQTRPAVATHPVTGERVWFNQADQFHPSTYPARLYDALIALHGDDPETLPSYATFGDGARIPAELLDAVREAGAALAVAEPWRRGEVLWLDNLLCAHGRNPFRGERRILVSLA